MVKTSTTTLELPEQLKTRIVKLAKKAGKTPHAMMLDALELHVQREENVGSFVREARETDRAIDEGEEVYAADDVHAWMERLARGENPARPKPWRG